MRSACIILLAATSPFLTAQITGTAGTPGAGTSRAPGSGTNSSNFPGTTGTNPGSSPAQTYPGMDQETTSYFGKVAMADGSPQPGTLAVMRNCLGSHRTVAYTDGKGQFNFSTSGPGSMTALGDASDTGSPTLGSTRGMGSRQSQGMSMANCELTVELPGYRADIISLDRFHDGAAVADVGTIVLHRLANVEGTSVSATLFTAPPDARKAYEKGLQSLQKNKLADARKDLTKAVTVYPKFANAWLGLGRAEERQNQNEAARDAFLKALEADPKLVEAQVELGVMAARDKKWREAAGYLDTALKLDPVDFPQIWFTDAVANFNSGNFDGAEKMAREALKIDTAHKNPMIDQLLGMALAQKHDFAGAAEELRTYLKLAPTAADFTSVKAQLAKIEELQAQSAH